MRVLVTGGAGYIGSVVTEEVISSGHEAVVFDNLSEGHREAVADRATLVEGDLNDSEKFRQALKDEKIEAVIHMAAHALVGESVEDPAKYYSNNLTAGLEMLNAMHDVGIRRIVFSSTAAVYGEPVKQPIEEIDPANPTNPYGETKLAFEQALKWYGRSYGFRYTSLRYFNAAGATKRCGESHNPETHLIPIVLEVAAGKRASVEVFGDDYPTRDGTCVRDYIHVSDLARAHVMALREDRNVIFNLGCGGDGYSVQEVIAVAREVTGRKIPITVGPRRPGDPAVLIASSEKIKSELGWQPELQNLHTIVESAWRWMLEHPDGYR